MRNHLCPLDPKLFRYRGAPELAQFWRDAINACYRGAAPAQPVMQALAEVVRARGRGTGTDTGTDAVPVPVLTRYRLQRVVSAREEDALTPATPRSLAALEQYAEGTDAQLLLLQVGCDMGLQ